MPEFRDGPDTSSSTSQAGMLPSVDLPLNSGLLPSPTAASWSVPSSADDVRAGTALSVPFAYQAARWQRIARRVWYGRDDAEIPQWIRQDMSPSGQPGPELDEEAQLPLHHGIQLRELRPMEPRAAFASVPVAANVSLISLALPSSSPSSSSPSSSSPLAPLPRKLSTLTEATRPPWQTPASSETKRKVAGASASILQFPAGIDYVFPDNRMPPEYSESKQMPCCSTVRQTISVFSLTGGTGRTSLSAGLARVLAGSGLRVVLADTSAHSLLPRLFGGGESRQGVLRRFVPVAGGRNQIVTQVSLAVEAFAGDDVEQYRVLHEFSRETAGMDRIVWDLGGAPLDWAAKVLRISTQILVPLLPNMQSLVQLQATRRFLDRVQDGRSLLTWHYVLNGFDEGDAAHVDIRGRLRQLLGEQLLEESLRSSTLVDEALSRGRTVLDHAPQSELAADMWRLGCRIRQVDELAGDTAPLPSAWVEP